MAVDDMELSEMSPGWSPGLSGGDVPLEGGQATRSSTATGTFSVSLPLEAYRTGCRGCAPREEGGSE